ncbi:CFI-box-CTERM domain-containing protein [Planctomycetota bacterium]
MKSAFSYVKGLPGVAGFFVFSALMASLLFATSITVDPSNTPDPFNPWAPETTNLSFTTDGTDDADVAILDDSGAIVKHYYSDILPDTLWESDTEGGADWDGKDDDGVNLPVGTYTQRVRVGSQLNFDSKKQGSGVTFNVPSRTYVDSNGNFYILDVAPLRVSKFSPLGLLLLQFDPDPGDVTSTTADGIAVDDSENIYIADATANTIIKYDSSGENPVLGWATGLTTPVDLSIYNGELYIGDDGTDLIYKVALATGGAVNDTGAVIPYDVMAVAVGSTGQIYVFMDDLWDNYVYRYDTDGSDIDDVWIGWPTWSYDISISNDGSNDYVYLSYSVHNFATVYFDETIRKLATTANMPNADWGIYDPQGNEDGELSRSKAISTFYDGNNTIVYLASEGNRRIDIFEDDTVALTFREKYISDPETVIRPNGVAIDSNNNIFVTLHNDQIVRKYSPDGTMIEFGSPGAGLGEFRLPWGAATDTAGNIYISDGFIPIAYESGGILGRIQKFNSDGSNPVELVTYQDVDAIDSKYQGLTVDSSGNIYASYTYKDDFFWEALRGRIMKFNSVGVLQDSEWLTITGSFAYDMVLSPDETRLYCTIAVDNDILMYDTANIAGGPLQTVNVGGSVPRGIACDDYGNVYVAVDNNIRKYTPDLLTLLDTFVIATGSADGELNVPNGFTLTPDGSAIWIADKTNNRLQKFTLDHDSVKTDSITINNGVAAAPVITNVTVDPPAPVRAEFLTFNVIFDQPMNTGVNPEIKLSLNGIETVINKTGYASNVWTGTATVPAGNDGDAIIFISGARDNDANDLQNPNPDISYTITVDTTAPAAPTITPDPPDTTTKSAIQLSGVAEAYSLLEVRNYDAASGGSLIASNTGIYASATGTFENVSIDLQLGDNYLTLVTTDLAGNMSAEGTRKKVTKVNASPGLADISPSAPVTMGDTGTWILTYTAIDLMADGTVTFTIPDGWSQPGVNPIFAGYTTISENNGVTNLAISTLGQVITATFDSASGGEYFKIEYGDTSGGASAAEISTGAALGSNVFTTQSAADDPGHDGPFQDVVSPTITVNGTGLDLAFIDAGVATVYKGETEVKLFTLDFANTNQFNDCQIQNLVLTIEDGVGGGIVPDTAVSRVILKDDSENVFHEDAGIEGAGSTITLNLSASPLTIPAGSSSTKYGVYVDIAAGATAANIALGVDADTDLLARDAVTQLTVDVSGTFPMAATTANIIAYSDPLELQTGVSDPAAGTVSKGQTSYQLMTFTLDNTTVGSNAVAVTEFTLTVQDGGGVDIDAPNSVISRIRLQNADTGAAYIDRAVTEGGGSNGRVTLSLILDPIIVPFDEDVDVELLVGIAAGTAENDVMLTLEAGTDVKWEDSVDANPTNQTANALAPSAFAMDSGVLTIEDPSAIKIVSTVCNPTVDMFVGEPFEVTVTMEYLSGDTTALVTDDATDLIFDIAGDVTAEFTVTPQAGNPASLTGPAGSTIDLVYDVVQNLGTTNGVMTVDVAATGPYTVDSNDAVDDDPLEITDTDGADTADTVNVNQANVDAIANAVTPVDAGSGQTDVLVLDLTVTNNTGAPDTVTGIVVTGTNTDDDDVAWVRAYQESGGTAGFQVAEDLLMSAAPVAFDNNNEAALNTPANNVLPAGPGGTMQIYITYEIVTTPTENNILDAVIAANGITLNINGGIESFTMDSAGQSTVDIVADRLIVTALETKVLMGDRIPFSIQAMDANGNIDKDIGAATTITITITDSNDNSAIVDSTTLAGGTTGSNITEGTLTQGEATVTITDDDPANNGEIVTVTPTSPFGTNTADSVQICLAYEASITEGGGSTDISESGTDDTYTMILLGKPEKTVAVNIAADSQSQVTPAALYFTPSNWNTAQTVTVSAINDDNAEGNHTSTISHTISTIDAYFIGVAVAGVTANITDNDTAGVSVTESGGSTDVQEGSTTDNYTVVLTSKPTANVTITISPDADSTVGANPLTFTDLNWSAAQTVVVTPVDDAANEGGHTSIITHSAASGDNNYNGIAIASVTANITDDEPFADAGNDYAANPGLLYLDGTGSSGLTAITYSWTQTGGTAVTLSGNLTATPSFYAYAAGAYTFELTVEDQAAATDTDTVTVTVQNVAPVAVITPGYFAMEMGDNKQLSGGGSYDANGTAIDTYTWNLAGAYNPVGSINTVLNNAASAAPIFTPATAGVYHLSLMVSAGGQNSGLTETTIVVNDFIGGVVPPVAYAGPGRTAALNTLITLYGHDSLDADSRDEYPDLEFTWRQTGGPAVALSDTSVPQPTFTPLVAGWYKFGLIVRDTADDNLYSEEDTVTVLAFDKNTNYPPTAVPKLKTFTDTNLDGAINAEETITLTATNSKDQDQDALTNQWQQTSGPGFYTILPSETSTEITFTPMSAGSYVFQLTVNDGQIDSAAVALEIPVVADDTAAPVAKAYANGYRTLYIDAGQGATITLDGTASTGTDGASAAGLTFQWRQTQGPAVKINNSATSTATLAPAVSRTYKFQLTVTDPYGVTASDSVLAAVSTYDAVFNPTGNSVPRPVITAPAISETGEAITLNASNSYDNGLDPDGVNDQNDGLEIFWTQPFGPVVELDLSTAFAPTFTPQLAGTYTFECYVDDGADISPPAEIIIEVEDPTPDPGVTVTESPDSMTVQEGNAVTYSIVLNSRPASKVIITITADYQSTASPSTLTFTSANWNLAQNVTITTTDDSVWESEQTSTITHSAASSDNDYDQISIAGIVVEIIDNDTLPGANNPSATSGGGGGGGGCFIATAAYGSYSEKHVILLREFRDSCLITNTPGRWLVSKYCQYSPPLAASIENKPVTKTLVRLSLLPIIALSWYLLKANTIMQLLLITLAAFACYKAAKRLNRKPAA